MSIFLLIDSFDDELLVLGIGISVWGNQNCVPGHHMCYYIHSSPMRTNFGQSMASELRDPAIGGARAPRRNRSLSSVPEYPGSLADLRHPR